MYICLCLGVTTITVQHAIDAGARSTKQRQSPGSVDTSR
jgi:bacterioferritin-associated ferredoxin